ncbi:GM10719 [Drosophila sechellia]|uniref:GM10719 n=1 Tax=Drosophila sechellia TaxID=7238 RepID=B4I3K7_DROSE|nr:GM10719 [Drosophila sechellia]
MHFFIVPCLLGLAAGIPQGYNYQAQQQLQSSAQAGQLRLAFPFRPFFSPLVADDTSSSDFQVPKLQQVLNVVRRARLLLSRKTQASTYQQQATQSGANLAYNALPQAHQPQQQHLVSKDIYVHVPPAEEPEDRYPQPVLPPAPPRKHYRIVFIKAPTPSVSKAALRIKQAPVEEKTIIYVLTKKPDPLDLQTAIEEIAPKQPSKPEVFFIKYKTQEEAAHAQRTIQAQYDQLGGTSQVSDEGVAPVTSVIGVLDNQRNSGVASGQFAGSLPNSYLPTNLRA